MTRDTHSTISETADIDEAASIIVAEILQNRWIVRKRLPDYFLDYDCERKIDNEPAAITFSSQQKGHNVFRGKGGFVSQKMPVKHLKYYLSHPNPVFLIVVDVSTKAAYYIFVQEWIEDNVAPKRLGKNKTINVTIPRKNDLRIGDAFWDEVQRAINYMRDKNPGSVAAAMRHDAAQIEKIDPRFNVTLQRVDEWKHYVLAAKETVNAQLSMSPIGAQKFNQLQRFGRTAEFADGEITISGLPIINEIAKTAARMTVTMGALRWEDAEIRLWSVSGATPIILPYDAVLTSGVSGSLFRAKMKDSPLFFEVEVERNGVSLRNEGRMIIGWDFKNTWSGRFIDELPHFDEVSALLDAIIEGRDIRHEIYIKGLRYNRGHFGKPSGSNVTSFLLAQHVLRMINFVRELAATFNVRPKLPVIDGILTPDWDIVGVIFALMRRGIVELTMPEPSISAEFINIENTLRASAVNGTKLEEFVVGNLQHSWNIFDVPINFKNLELRFFGCMVSATESVKELLKNPNFSGPAQLEVKGIGETRVIIKRNTTNN